MEILQAITMALEAAEKFTALAIKLKEIARQNQELTPEQDAEFDKRLLNLFSQPHWRKE